MPTTKLGQASTNEVNDLMQKHWDADMKLRDILSTASLEVKLKLPQRLTGLIDEIKSEMARTEIGVQ